MKDKKKVEVCVNELIADGKLDVEDLCMFLAQEECRKANGLASRMTFGPGQILAPGFAQSAVAIHFVRLAQDYLRAHGMHDVRNKDVVQLLFVVMADRLVMIIMNPAKYVEAFGGELPEKVKKKREKIAEKAKKKEKKEES